MVAMESNANNEVLEAGSTEKDASQAVQVAVHIRPLIAQERIQGCKECISVVPGEPQIQLGAHAFTFDHVYGSIATSPANIFDQCVLPLVEGLFQGYNATVLAYGQTGSGKTYTMGTGYTVGGSTEGIIPRVMDTIFKKVQSLKDKSEFQLRVSFIEILKEEIHDLLDPNPPSKTEAFNGGGGAKALPLTKPPIQIRETGNGGITLAGVSEIDVSSLGEMANCLEQGSLCRATGSTNMNSRSSRSHAIFTINVEQRRKWDAFISGDNPLPEDTTEDFLCAKLHLVDLAGSERAKRTGADGNRFKEGVHINRGLLALGNVISALGDDKKRKEGGHVPYRDSKLTRLLQDSLGGNSRTVMLACVSPADSNAEETLNTLKYANRARNIQNKPTVNRDPMAAEMQRMRHQLEIMQAELLCARATGSSEEIQILKQKIAWLESSNFELRQELQHFHASATTFSQQALEAQLERDKLRLKFEKIRSGNALAEDDEDDRNGMDLVQSYLTKIQGLEHELQRAQVSRSNLPDIDRTASALSCLSLGSTASELTAAVELDGISGDMTSEVDVDAVVVKEMEHNMLQDCLDKELQELNQRLEQKEAEMKSYVKSDTLVLKQHFEKKLVEMEEEKKTLQKERDTLLKELEALSSSSDEQAHKMQETYKQKLTALEHQISELKKKQENQAQLLRQKQRSDEAAKRLQEDILRIKQQKVQLQNKIKQESEQFRQWKTAREKEVLQLRKEGRKNEYEMHKLQALHQRQKMVLQRKTEEAAIATKRLKELLEARKISSRETAQGMGSGNGAHGQNNEKALQQWLDQELEVVVRVHEVRSAYEKESDSRAAFAKELANLKQEEETPQAINIPMQFDQNGSPLSALQRASNPPIPSMSPSARRARIRWLESMINASSTALVAMASQLSEAEERERSFSGRARWQHLRTMGDMKNMLNLAFNAAALTRCQLRDKEVEVGEIKEKIAEVTEALRQSEIQRKEFERRQHIGEKAVAVVLATTTKDGSEVAIKRGMEELSGGSARQRLCKDDICETNGIPYHLRKGSRHSNFYKADESDDSESIESDTDMDVSEVDLSDEDWLEEEEKPGARSRAQLMKAGKKSVVGGRKSSMSSIGSQQQESTEEKQRSGISSETGEEFGERLHVKCCSCSTTSGCKTKKCECKAAGNLCGTGCTCKAGKCANREISDVAFDSSEISNVDSQANERSDSVTGADVIEGKLVEVIYKPEQMLARHGAKLLDRAWKEEIHVIDAGLSSALSQASSGSEDSDMPQRHPLSDIGNKKKITSNQQNKKPMKKQKLQKTLVQIVPVPRQSNSENNPSAAVGRQVDAEHVSTPLHSASSLPSTTSINNPIVASAQDASNTRNERPPSGQVQPAQMMANAILPSSPLRARNRHRSGVNGSVANKRLGGGAGSPEKSVDKENLR